MSINNVYIAQRNLPFPKSILYCTLVEDLERNDGSPEKPYYMSKELMKILKKKNKRPKSEEES